MIVDMLHLAAMLATFALAMGWYPCGCCGGCSICTELNAGSVGSEVVVEISGVTDDGCGSCTSINGAYTATFNRGASSDNICVWTYTLTSEVCTLDTLTVQLVCDPSTKVVTYSATLSDATTGAEVVWSDTYTTIDCTTACNTNLGTPSTITDDGVSGLGDVIQCEFAASVVTLTWSQP